MNDRRSVVIPEKLWERIKRHSAKRDRSISQSMRRWARKGMANEIREEKEKS